MNFEISFSLRAGLGSKTKSALRAHCLQPSRLPVESGQCSVVGGSGDFSCLPFKRLFEGVSHIF